MQSAFISKYQNVLIFDIVQYLLNIYTCWYIIAVSPFSHYD